MTETADSPLSILIAEDGPADRLLLGALVAKLGHRVISAAHGLEAVQLFERERPQLVLLDVLMPVMDGLEAARRIKRLAGEQLVPIIFLTGLSAPEMLVRCLEAGGDDFLPKPYDPLVLSARIRAMNRLRLLQATMLEQRDLISRHNEHLLTEQRVAKAVFDRITHSGSLDQPSIRYRQSPHALFNGDLLLAAHRPSGELHVLLGDFTGHGLPAAIGAMPAADVFYSMTARGYGLAEILRELNTKLRGVLPRGMFCCTVMLNLDSQRGLLEVWNGGMPSGYLRSGRGGWTELRSQHLPLGIVEAEDFDAAVEVLPVAPGDHVLLLTDGLLESVNATEEVFGETRLQQLLDEAPSGEPLFERLEAALAAFGGPGSDDASLLEIAVGQVSMLPQNLSAARGWLVASQDWSASFEYRARTLKSFNPLPFLLQLLIEVPGLRRRSGEIYTVLAELYSNALEHGVMGLDSRLKNSPEGFAEYYRQRALRLAALGEGHVRFALQIIPQGMGGRLQVRVEDSGRGFDVESELRRQREPTALGGRGLRLVQRLSDHCRWDSDGRGVTVEFRWDAQA